MSDRTSGFERGDVDGERTLFVRGEIDMGNAGEFRAQLSNAMGESHSPTMVDLSGVDFIDSSGIKVLVNALGEAPALGTELVLVDPSGACRRVFEILGLTEHFKIREN